MWQTAGGPEAERGRAHGGGGVHGRGFSDGARFFSLSHHLPYLALRSPRPPRRRRGSPYAQLLRRTRPGTCVLNRDERGRGGVRVPFFFFFFFFCSALIPQREAPCTPRPTRALSTQYSQVTVRREDGDGPVILGHGEEEVDKRKKQNEEEEEREERPSTSSSSFPFLSFTPRLSYRSSDHVGILALPHVEGQDPAPASAGRVRGGRDWVRKRRG